jgi:hypothetical protein
LIITWDAVNFSSSHIMMVVTSPMGDQAPPALAAITVLMVNRLKLSVWV